MNCFTSDLFSSCPFTLIQASVSINGLNLLTNIQLCVCVCVGGGGGGGGGGANEYTTVWGGGANESESAFLPPRKTVERNVYEWKYVGKTDSMVNTAPCLLAPQNPNYIVAFSQLFKKNKVAENFPPNGRAMLTHLAQ